MIFLMMAAHDTSTSTATTMVYHLAANPEWQDRCRDESDRLGDGPLDIEALEKLEALDLVMNESIRMVTPVQWAMRQAVRDTDLLGFYIPAGHQCHRLSGAEPPVAGDLDRSGEVRPGPVRRAPQRAQAAPLRVHAVRRRRAQVHRDGVRPAGSQDDPAPAAAQVPPGSCPGPDTRRRGTTAACRCRWTACRSCCARCADCLRPRSAAGWRTRSPRAVPTASDRPTNPSPTRCGRRRSHG